MPIYIKCLQSNKHEENIVFSFKHCFHLCIYCPFIVVDTYFHTKSLTTFYTYRYKNIYKTFYFSFFRTIYRQSVSLALLSFSLSPSSSAFQSLLITQSGQSEGGVLLEGTSDMILLLLFSFKWSGRC